MSLFPLALMWLINKSGDFAAPTEQPAWPTPSHPPPSRLPAHGRRRKKRSTALAAPKPHHGRRRHMRKKHRHGKPHVTVHEAVLREAPTVPETPAMPDLPHGAPTVTTPPLHVHTTTASRSPEAAARDLYDYVNSMIAAHKASQLGTRGHPNATVQAAQEDMGGITADGIYGPGTRARGKALLGRTFPARVSGIGWERPLYIP